LERSDLYAPDHHWGDAVIDLDAYDLPALKATYLLHSLPREGRVLEIGCGGGRLLNTIAAHRPGLELDGCDIRPLGYEPTNFAFAPVDPNARELPYPDDSFDAIVLYDVLEHVLDPLEMITSAHRVTRRGGQLVSFTPLEGQAFSFYRLYRRLFGDNLYVETKEHVQAFSESSLRAVVETAYTIDDAEFAYHFFGHVMDATLFALLRIPAIRGRFWESNPYYRETQTGEPSADSALGHLLRAANGAAYVESRLLRHSRAGAAGMLFTASAK
jgi:SAM-dependent methyltransferase